MKKRLFSLFLAAVMMFSLLPAEALAAELDNGDEPVCAHEYAAVVTAPACEAAGYTTYTCALCGDAYTGDETQPTGHTYVDGVCGCGVAEPAPEEPTPAPEPTAEPTPAPVLSGEERTLYFYNVDGWEDVYANVFYDEPAFADVYDIELESQGNTWYVVVPVEANDIVFHDILSTELNYAEEANEVEAEIVEEAYYDLYIGKWVNYAAYTAMQADINALADMPYATEADIEALDAAFCAVQDNLIVYAEDWDTLGKLFDLSPYYLAQERMDSFWLDPDLAGEEQVVYADGTLEALDGNATSTEMLSKVGWKHSTGRTYTVTRPDGTTFTTNNSGLFADYNGSAKISVTTGTYTIKYGSNTKTLDVKVYHNVTVAIEGHAGGYVTYGGQNYTSGTTFKYYPGNNQAITVFDVGDGYSYAATGVGLNPTASGTLTVTYSQAAGNFTESKTGNGTITIGGNPVSSNSYAAGDHAIMVSPDYDKGYYVKSLKVGGTVIDLDAQTFTKGGFTYTYNLKNGETANIEVEFAKYTVTMNTTVSMNGNLIGQARKDQVVNQLLPGIDPANVVLKTFVSAVYNKFCDWDAGGLNVGEAVAAVTAFGNNLDAEKGVYETTERVNLAIKATDRYPAYVVAEDTTIKVVESRQPAIIELTTDKFTLPIAKIEDAIDVANGIKSAVTVKDANNGSLDASKATVTFTDLENAKFGEPVEVTIAFNNDGQNYIRNTVKKNVTVNQTKYTVKFYAEDGETSIGEQVNVPFGTAISVPTAPAKPDSENGQYSYTFAGWKLKGTEDTAIVTLPATVEGNAEYVAVYTPVTRRYTVTWKDGDGNVIYSEQVNYGTVPSYNMEKGVPGKTNTAQYTYTFNNTWSPEIVAMDEKGAEYTAQFDSTVNRYTVKFVDEDTTTVLGKQENVDYDTAIAVPENPTKTDTTEFDYEFSHWKDSKGNKAEFPATVTGDETYTAVYSSTKQTYTVKFVDENGDEIDSKTLEYGADIVKPADPTKAATAQYSYEFAGWTPAVAETVTGDVTYTATYTETPRSYTVIWQDEDGTELEKDENVPYGTTPSFNGKTPEKEDTAEEHYAFAGWSPSISAVTGDVTYTATYTTSTISYTITFVDEEGNTLFEKDFLYGATPSYEGKPPVKEGDAQYSYTFTGWDPAITTVTEAATYTTVFEQKRNEYTITWKNADGSTIYTANVAYGETPAYNQATYGTPVKAETQAEVYEFIGWTPAIESVTGPAAYTADFEASAHPYKVIWDVDGQTIRNDVKYGDTLVGPTPTKELFVFKHWSAESATGAAYDMTKTVTGDLTLYAVWGNDVNENGKEDYTTADPGRVIAYIDGVANEVVFADFVVDNLLDGQDTPAFADPTRTGWIFTGWDPEVTATVDGDVTYQACWTEDANTNGVPDDEETITVSVAATAGGSASLSAANSKVIITKGGVVDGYTQYTIILDTAENAENGDKVTLTATPTGNYYVDAVTVDETVQDVATLSSYTKSTRAWAKTFAFAANDECLVDVAFAERKLVLNDLSQGVGVSGWGWTLDENYKASLTPATFVDYTKSVGITASNDIDILMHHREFFGVDRTNVQNLNLIDSVSIVDAPPVGKTFEVVCNGDARFPKISVDNVAVQLKESRPAPTITATAVSLSLEEWPTEGLEALVSGNVTITAPNGTPVKYSVSPKLADPGDGQTYTATYTVTIEESASVRKASASAALTIKNFADKNNNDVDDDGEAHYTIVYNVGNEEYAKYENTLVGVSMPKPEDPTREYYTFAGWTPAVADAVSGDATYTATWTAINDTDGDNVADEEDTHVVTWMNGDEEIYSEEVAYGAKPVYNETAYGKPAKAAEGDQTYTFSGWDPAIGAETVVTGAITYYAQFSNDAIYTIGFSVDGEVNYYDYVSEKVAKVEAPENYPAIKNDDGRVFRHWAATANGETAFDFSTTLTGDTTLYAVWDVDTNNNEVADNKETMTIAVSGEGKVTIDGDEVTSGSYVYNSVATTHTIVAAPADTDGSDGSADYVASIKLGDTDVNGAYSKYVFTAEAVALTNGASLNVAFGDVTVVAKSNTIPVNGDRGTLQLDYSGIAKDYRAGLVKENFLQSGPDFGTYTVQMSTRTGWLSSSDINAIAHATYLDLLTRDLRILWNGGDNARYPAITSNTAKVSFQDTRDAAVVEHNGDTYIVDDPSLLVSANFVAEVMEDITVNGETLTLTTGLVTPAEGFELGLPGEGEEANVTLTVTVYGTASYAGATTTITVKVENPEHLSPVTFESGEGYTVSVKDSNKNPVASGDELDDGIYTVTVTPDHTNGWYVTGLTINGKTVQGTFEDYVFTTTFEVKNGTTAENMTSYEIKATADQRKITTYGDGETVYEVRLQDSEAQLHSKIYEKVVKETESNHAPDTSATYYTVDAKNELGEQNVTITYPGDEAETYPAVSVTVKVNVIEGLPAATIPSYEKIVIVEKMDEVIDTIRADILASNNGLDSELLTVAIAEDEQIVAQGGKDVYTVSIVIAEDEDETKQVYKPFTGTTDVNVEGKVQAPVVTIADADNGAVALVKTGEEVVAAAETYEPGTYDIVLTPDKGYHASALTVVIENIDDEGIDADHNAILAGLKLDIKNGTGLALGKVPTYTITGEFTKTSIVIPAEDTLTYWIGMGGDLNKLILAEFNDDDSDKIAYTPDRDTLKADAEIFYKAREATTYQYPVSLSIFGYALEFEVPLAMGELWLNIGDTIPTDLHEPTQEDIEKLAENLIKKVTSGDLGDVDIGLGDILNPEGLIEKLKTLLYDEIMEVADYANFFNYYGAHTFGKLDVETVKMSTDEESIYGEIESNLCALTLLDTRIPTEIRFIEGATVTYNVTGDDAYFLNALVDGIYTVADENGEGGVKVAGPEAVKLLTKKDKLNASNDAHEVAVEFPGNMEYQDCEAVGQLIVTKAPVDVIVESSVIRYTGNPNALPISTEPAGVETVKFVVGLDVADLGYEDGSLVGYKGSVQLMVPESLQKWLDLVGLKNGMTVSLDSFQKALEGLGSLGNLVGGNEAINTLLNMLGSIGNLGDLGGSLGDLNLPDINLPALEITIGGQLPTDIGVYLIGAVSADANYETDFGVGVIAIHPDGHKAELDWIMKDENAIISRTLLTEGVYDMGAKVTKVYEGTIEAAEKNLMELYLGVDIEGNIGIVTEQEKLNVGAYVELAMLMNWGNEIYYGMPIVRAFVVIPEMLTVTFVDENGENPDRHFVFDNTAKTMDVLVTGLDDEVMLDTRTMDENDPRRDNLQMYYAGIQTNIQPVYGEETPVHAGVYGALAVYLQRDEYGMISHLGVGVGAMAIEPAASDITVDQKIVKYTGEPVTTTDMIHASSAVEGLKPDTTVITAGITTDGTLIESLPDNGLNAIVGTVNVDLPKWLDTMLAENGSLTKGYSEEGIDRETLLAYMDKLDTLLAEQGIDLGVISGLKSIVEQLPGQTKITLRDQAEVAPAAVGAYLVIGVVTDSDHYPSADANILVIYPDAQEMELQFNKDWNDNNIFTWNYLQTYDLNASAYTLDGEFHQVATDLVTNIYLGVTDDFEIKFTFDKEELDVGAYTQVAFLLSVGSKTYYAEPIARAFVIVPNMATVEFVDEDGDANSDRLFTFNNQPQGMDVRVTVDGQVVADPGEALEVRYVGVQTNLQAYNSTEAPIHAGSYVVTATYTTRDAQDRLNTLGVAVGAMVIEPAESTTEVENKIHAWNGEAVHVNDMVTVTSAVAGLTPDATIVSAAVQTDGTFSENFADAITGSVNIDLPKWLDKYMADTGITPQGINGLLSTVSAVEDKLIDLAAKAGVDLSDKLNSLTALESLLGQLPADVKLTYNDNMGYDAVGAYLVIALVTDSDHYPSMDAGMLIIHPELVKADLQWQYVDSNNIFQLSTLTEKKVDLSADAYVNGEVVTTVDPTEIYLGIDTQNWKVLYTNDQTKLTMGAYTEIAWLLDLNSVTYYAMPISRGFVVVPNTVTVEFVDENGDVNPDRMFTYDGTAHGMDVLVTENGETVDTSKGELKVVYTGIMSNGAGYYGTQAPSHTGVYDAVATYTEYDAEGRVAKFGMGVGVMVINPAPADITVTDKIVPTGTAVKPTEMITVTGAVDGDTIDTTIITTQLATDGTFSENGLSALQGAVNVDFPSWLDVYLKKIPVLNDGYESGLSGKLFVNKAQVIRDALAAMGLDSTILDGVITLLDQIPEGVVLTFHNQANLTYTAIGTYLIVGVVTDTNYTPAMDAGFLVIHPNVEVGELNWKNVDSNNVFYLNTLTEGYLDAEYSNNGVVNAEMDPTEIYLGVDKDNWLLHLSRTQPDSIGVYTEIAWLADTDGDAHYALPILRPVVVVDGIYDVLFKDENGEVNHDRLFVYNGEPQPIGTIHIYGKGIDETCIPAEDELKVLYLGIDAMGQPWKSSQAPTNAGAYTVVATYADYDEAGKLIGGGAGVGTMVIALADLALDMVDTTVTYDGEGHFIDVTSNNAEADYLTVIVDEKNKTANLILEDDLTIASQKVLDLLANELGMDVSSLLTSGIDVKTVRAAMPLIAEKLKGFDVPGEIAERLTSLPAFIQAAINKLVDTGYDLVIDHLDDILALVDSNLPEEGILYINGELPSDVGEYKFYGFALTANYEPEATEGTLTIVPREVTVTADDLSKVYGEADPAVFTGTVEGAVADEAISVTYTREEGENAGEYVITPVINGEYPNYTITVVPGTFTITPAEVTIAVNDQTKVYGLADPTLDGTVTVTAGNVTAEELGVSYSRVAGENVGTYAITASYTESDNYVVTVEDGTFTITKATVTVKADSAEKTYGDTDPAEFTGTVTVTSGAVTAEELGVSYSREAGENVGTYAITASYTESDNYDVKVIDGIFTIRQAELTVKANDAGKIYGEADPTFTSTVTGLVNGDTEEALNLSYSRVEGENIGTYTVTVTGSNANYAITFQTGTLTIAPKAITEADVQLDGELIFNDEVQTQNVTVTDGITYDVTGNTGYDAGGYVLTVTGNGNYTGSVDVEWSIAPAVVTYVVDNAGKIYGDADPEFTGTISNNSTLLDDFFDVEFTREEGENIGEYTIDADVSSWWYDESNFEVVVETGTLTITKAAATVTVANQTKVYGDADPELAYTVTGEKGTDKLVVSVSREAGEDVGTYAITATVAENANYDVTVVAGELTITAKTLTDAAVELDGTLTYTGAEQTQAITVPDGVEYTVTGNKGTDAGEYTMTVTFTGNHTGTVEVKWNIAPAKAAVVVKSITKLVGTTDPAFTGTVTGVLGEDDLGLTYSRAAGEEVGTYAITAVAANTNYAVEVTDGVLTVADIQILDGSTYQPVTEVEITVYKNGEETSSDQRIVTVGVAPDVDFDVAYSSTNEGVARINEIGKITGVAPGTTEIEITVTMADGTVFEFTVPVEVDLYVYTTGIEAEVDELDMEVGDKETVKVTIEPADASDKTVKAESGDENVAKVTVNEDGSITVEAVAPGTTTITVTSKNGQTDEITVTVAKLDPTVTAPEAKDELTYTGEAQALVTAGTTDGGKLVYSLTEDGEYSETIPTGTDAGKYTVWYKVIGDDTYNDVAPKSVEVEIAKAKATVVVKSITKLVGTTDPAFTGTVTGVLGEDDLGLTYSREAGEEVGTYAITAVAANTNYDVTVTDGVLTVALIAPDMTDISITIYDRGDEITSDTAFLGVNADPEDVIDSITYRSADESTAKVNEDGEVTGAAAGTTDIIITVTTKDGTVFEFTVPVEVDLYIPVTSLVVNPDSLDMKVGDEETLTATVKPDDATTKYVIWWTDDESEEIIRIQENEDGTLTVIAVGVGSTVIYAAANDVDRVEIPVSVTKPVTGPYPIDLSGSTDPVFKEGDIVEVDGVSYKVDKDGIVWVAEKTHKIVTYYGYAKSSDIDPIPDHAEAHRTYPNHMNVWYLTFDENGLEYQADRIKELDDFLLYQGTSIRLKGNQGIRIFTTVNEANRNKLIQGKLISHEVMEGYKLVEYGTLFKWGTHETMSLTYDPAVKNYSVAYSKATGYDAIFSRSGSNIMFTGMLTNLQLDKCDEEMLLRPYMVLEKDGEQIVIYGGTLQRTIGYVAYQNRNENLGTAGNAFIRNILDAVYGKDFKG